MLWYIRPATSASTLRDARKKIATRPSNSRYSTPAAASSEMPARRRPVRRLSDRTTTPASNPTSTATSTATTGASASATRIVRPAASTQPPWAKRIVGARLRWPARIVRYSSSGP